MKKEMVKRPGAKLRSKASLSVAAFLAITSLSACGPSPSHDQLSLQGNENRIIGGFDVGGSVRKSTLSDSEGFARTVVALYDVSKGGLCTASILSETILLTAAHCLEGPPENMKVVFGAELNRPEDRELRNVSAYQVSPLWPLRQEENINAGDIAVVRFEGGLPAGYHPAKMLNDMSALRKGASVLLAGYGQNDGVKRSGGGKLRYVEVQIEDAAFSETEVLVDQRQGRGACRGDSGGPAYAKVNGEWMLFGVTNRGINDPKNDCSVSAAYASLGYYKTWVQRTAQALDAKAAPMVVAAVGF